MGKRFVVWKACYVRRTNGTILFCLSSHQPHQLEEVVHDTAMAGLHFSSRTSKPGEQTAVAGNAMPSKEI